MFAWLWAKLSGFALAAGGVLIALAGAWLYGRHQAHAADDAETAARDAKQAAADAAERAHQTEVRHDVEVQTAQLPDAPPQQVAAADPATAAGRLRDNGWTRD
jgi:hypothetical protein